MKRVAIAVAVVAALALAPAAVAAGVLSGKYETKIKSPPKLAGTWVLDFTTVNGSSVVKITVNGHLVAADEVFYKGDKIRFGRGYRGARCKSSGFYTFKVTGNKLNFTVRRDSCTGRKDVLLHTFTKIS